MSVKQLYEEFHKLYLESNPNLSKKKAHEEVNIKWNSMKTDGKKLDLEKYKIAMTELKGKKLKRKITMFDYATKSKHPNLQLSSRPPPSQAVTSSEIEIEESCSVETVVTEEDESNSNVSIESNHNVQAESNLNDDAESNDNIQAESNLNDNAESVSTDVNSNNDEGSCGQVYNTPKQNLVKDEIAKYNSRLVSLNEAINLGMGEENVANFKRQIKEISSKRKQAQQHLLNLQRWQRNSLKARNKKKAKIDEACKEFPGLSEKLSLKETCGQHPIEHSYPDLHHVILDIATIGAATSDKRREDLFRSVRTLDDLHKALSDLGFQIGRTTLYRRLLPKSQSSVEAKRHVRTVPVRY